MERIPPQDILAEGQVLGSMLLAAELEPIRRLLAADDFFNPAHQLIYRVLCEMADARKPLDIPSAFQAFGDRQLLREIGQGTDDADGRQYLVDLVEETPSPANAVYHARIIKDKAQLRKLLTFTSQMADEAFAPDADAADVLGRFQEGAYALTTDTAHGRTLTAAQAGQEVLEHSERVERGQEAAALSLGFEAFDGPSGGGIKPGQLVVIAGTTSIGKSALATKIAMRVAEGGGVVKMFSKEMANTEVAQRMLSILAGVNGLKMGRGRLGAAEWEKIQEAQAQLDLWGKRLELTDQPMTVPAMEAELRRMTTRTGKVDLAIVDYLQIVPGTEGRSEREKINAITRGCKLMAKALRVPVLLLSQLSRAHQNDNRPPKLRDLKESSTIEQDADGVILLHKPADSQADPFGSYEIWARVAKWRGGMTTTWQGPDAIRLKFCPKYTDFVST